MHSRSILKDPVNIAFAVLAAAMITLSVKFQWFEWFYNYSRAHESLELDEYFAGFVAAGFMLPLFLVRWNRQLLRAHRDVQSANETATQIALHDPLTGLPNRRYFHMLTESAAKDGRAGREGNPLSILLIDLDRFKPINDLRGHDAGDALLCEVAARLREVCSDPLQAIRLGGDEFAVLTPPKSDPDANSRLARRLQTALGRPFTMNGWTATISCSIGIATWTVGMTASDLLRNADQAMYRAKALGRGTFVHFDEELGAAVREQAKLEADLRIAIMAGHIVPYFQPIYDIGTSALSGFEVLSRWEHPTRGFVPPDLFIPLAEDIGLIDTLSDAILSDACAALASWDTPLGLSFNLSPSQFGDLALPSRICAILQRHQLNGSRLEIEITERAVVADMAKAKIIIAELGAAGIGISLDDFGTGTSSLSTLAQLPFSKIKIDRSFIANIQANPMNAKIVSGVLALAASLALQVTAEGIETDEELAFLRARNCNLGQGYLFSRPRKADDIASLFGLSTGASEFRRRA